VVALDPARAFSAARARNAGLERLLELEPRLEYVQFVDGDCELAKGWLDTALAFLDARGDAAIAFGRRRERFPERSPYNRLADMEWDTPIGEAASCGGDALMRVGPLRAAGGFDASLIAGEEPELCLRLRRSGHRIHRLAAEMTLHDASLLRFSQFWRRAQRAGHAYAEAAWRHGRGPERFGVRRALSSALWALGVPVLTAVLCVALGRAGALALLAYPVLALRVAQEARRRGRSLEEAAVAAAVAVPGKFAELSGVVQFLWNHGLRRRETRLIEYK
jgi:GT2 family glycosyltransferase